MLVAGEGCGPQVDFTELGLPVEKVGLSSRGCQVSSGIGTSLRNGRSSHRNVDFRGGRGGGLPRGGGAFHKGVRLPTRGVGLPVAVAGFHPGPYGARPICSSGSQTFSSRNSFMLLKIITYVSYSYRYLLH